MPVLFYGFCIAVTGLITALIIFIPQKIARFARE